MAVIYLRHPRHGTKVACSDFEAEYDMQRGWEEFDPSEELDETVEDESSEPINELQPRRRGRRPKEASV